MNVELELIDVTADPRDGCAVAIFRERMKDEARKAQFFALWIDDVTAEAIFRLFDAPDVPATGGTGEGGSGEGQISAGAQMVQTLGGRVLSTTMIAIQNGVVRAELELLQGDVATKLRMQTSHAVLLALEARAPIYVDSDLLAYVNTRMEEARGWQQTQRDDDTGGDGTDFEIPVSVAERWNTLIAHYRIPDDDC